VADLHCGDADPGRDWLQGRATGRPQLIPTFVQTRVIPGAQSRFCHVNFIGRLKRPLARGLHQQAGFALMEILISILILLIAASATLSLISTSNANLSRTRAREAAVNLSRELLEKAHDIPYAQVGEPNWFGTSLEGTSGQTGSISSGGGSNTRATFTRRGTDYTVAVSTCAVDDAADGFGAHPANGHAWCLDSGTPGAADTQAEDFKRVTTRITWSFEQRGQPALEQTATFAANGAAVGPAVSDLTITSPAVSNPPVITNSSTTTVVFQGTSVGANDMKFSVGGVEQATGTHNNGNGTWVFNWDISQVTDGLYTIGATAIDALGTRGPTRSIQVKLARGVPVAPQRVAGGYNNVYASGTKTQAVELAWDANPEGNVTGYEVDKGGTTVCSASLAVSCIDLSPATSGSTTYTVKTLYTDGTGTSGFVSTNYSVTAPTQLPPAFEGTVGQASCGSNSMAITVPVGGVAAGSRIVLRLAIRGGSSGAVSASDSRGNSYAVDADPVPASHPLVVFSAHVATALVAGDTIQVNYPSGSTSSAVAAGAYSNIAATNAVDAVGGASGSSTAPSTSVTTTNANDLLLGATFSANNRSVTQPSGWTGLTTQVPDCGNGALGKSTNTGAYRIPGSAGTFAYDPALGGSGTWAGAVVAYKPGGATALTLPGTPTGLSVVANGDGTRTLTWTAPSGTPAVEFYRIYRDGRNYTDRIDTAGATSTSVTWTDTSTGGTSHTYRVTAASANLTESNFAGPVTG
jgi:hypothetical protein